MSNANASVNSSKRPLRADAAKNKQIILDTARHLFASRGMEVTLEQVAAAAGLGVGTVYRRFPTVDKLIDELFGARFIDWAARVEDLTLRAEADPWGAFEAYLFALAEAQGCDAAFAQLLVEPLDGNCRFGEMHVQTIRGAQIILTRARDAGVVRADLSDEYLIHLQLAILGIVGAGNALGASAARTVVKLFLAGSKPQEAHSDKLPSPTVQEQNCWHNLLKD
ncbi:TetR/AcrR family transcriptional regulator [Glutamicibacter uratoxydans]|uniref:TetR/AcrR family transcriptional regulator n=1 Tax=Glutamicibacter uratoxydans TaxID=43667 RepID=UPI0014769DBB|nr:TetR/AcrR family transcriptional regulator [Glutamicibacter uratoxydans]